MSQQFSRRHVLKTSLALGASLKVLLGPNGAFAQDPRVDWPDADAPARYGPLIADPNGLLDLPAGFSYRVLSETGQPMSDGLNTPGRPDGMAAFEGESPGEVILVRNHEMLWIWPDTGPFGVGDELIDRIDRSRVYDFRPDGAAHSGGTSTLTYNLQTGEVSNDYLSLAGTLLNCAGGPTPWGSWLSCEEIDLGPGEHAGKHHGYIFEVPSRAGGLVDPAPLKDMGRFVHEAAAVDPVSGAVYLTEDASDACFYRFLPNTPGQLHEGGTLQALTIRGRGHADARNHDDGPTFPAATRLAVEWIEVDEVDEWDVPIRTRMADQGAVVFSRGEGITFALDDDGRSIYFVCTEGGPAQLGQVFQYRPDRSDDTRGTLELRYESTSATAFDQVDNIVFAPWHDLILCEDGGGENFLRGLTVDGRSYPIARNAHERKSEFAGACFSPDGSTMFVNIQEPGITLAITGPWEDARWE